MYCFWLTASVWLSISLTVWLSKKDEFLRNPKNKELIIYCGKKLTVAECSVQYATGDADVLIAKTAVVKAECQPTCLIGNDTDLLILLIHHANAEAQPLYFKTGTKTWDINKTKRELEDLCENILLIHAFLGLWYHLNFVWNWKTCCMVALPF